MTLLTDKDLVDIMIEAKENRIKAEEYNEEIALKQNQTYESLLEEMAEFAKNMSEKRQTVEANQEAVRDGADNKRRKRQGMNALKSNRFLEGKKIENNCLVSIFYRVSRAFFVRN